MRYHFFDMDHTLINNDCDVSWKEFLIEIGVTPQSERARVAEFFAAYKRDALDVTQFLGFQLAELAGRTPQEVQVLALRHYSNKVASTVYPAGRALITRLQAAGEHVALLTATNRAVATPVAAALGIEHVIATELEDLDGRYTGRITGIYCFREGKLARLLAACAALGIALGDVYYYGDSTSDLCVLRAVGHPHAVNPMPALAQVALRAGWPVLDFCGQGVV